LQKNGKHSGTQFLLHSFDNNYVEQSMIFGAENWKA